MTHDVVFVKLNSENNFNTLKTSLIYIEHETQDYTVTSTNVLINLQYTFLHGIRGY